MTEQMDLEDKVAFITGTTRGVGKEIALTLASEGCNIVSTGKTDEPHDVLPGTIYETAEEVEERGSLALPIKLDVTDESSVVDAIEETVDEFGRIDILINNAGAIYLTPFEQTQIKQFDIMMDVNTRGAYLCIYHALPHLKEQDQAHVLNMSPPLTETTHKGAAPAPYGISKIGMTYLAKALAQELSDEPIGVNSMWPAVGISTAATERFGVPEDTLRTADIMAEAVREIVSRDPAACSGNSFYDEEVLRETGVTDFADYAAVEGTDPDPESAMLFDPSYERPE